MPGEPAGVSGAENSGVVATEADHQDDASVPGSGRWSFLREVLVLVAGALAAAMLIKALVVQPFYIPSGSMQDTLLIGDKVLVNKMVYHLRPIERGDVVVFNGQGSWNPPARPVTPVHGVFARFYGATLGRLFGWAMSLFGRVPGQVDYIKRVIGLPGDHVVCCNAQGQITVNGVPLNERSYLPPGARSSRYPFNVVVPPGRLWVMGDNRMYSADSRLHDCRYPDSQITCAAYDKDGTIPEDAVVGRAFMIVWPLNRIRILPVPSTFSQWARRHRRQCSGPSLTCGPLPV